VLAGATLCSAQFQYLWPLTHEDLRRAARVKVFMEFAGPALAMLGPLLQGNAAWNAVTTR
jgi:hypothetical protein